MIGRKLKLLASGIAPITLLVACGGGGSSGGSPSPSVNQSGVTSQIDKVPLAGQFLANCLNSGTAVISSFVGESPLSGVTGSLPTAKDVLASADPNKIPVIGGLVPSSAPPTDMVPIPINDALAMIPTSGLPVSLPVIGNAPVSCSDVPLSTSSLPDPTSVIGLVPVFNGTGDPVALVLATVGKLPNGSLPNPSDIALPTGTDTLPAPLASTVASLLSILGL